MSHDAHLPGYSIRRELAPAELLPAVGVGIAAGLAAFYVARLLLERTPLLPPEERERRRRMLERRTGRPIRALGPDMVGGADELDRQERQARRGLLDADDAGDADDAPFDGDDDLGLAARIREARGRR